ncbi:MAG: hypothetical protein K2P14_11010 [Anaeroplasmataceae bacterium]|nr:hypothetical protein [Anaeroplasmataceae bacterium]
MATALIIIAFIALFVGTIVLVQFPPIATEIYTVANSLIDYMAQGAGILWFFLPKTLTLTVLTLVISIEVIYRGFLLFLWIYNHLKQ